VVLDSAGVCYNAGKAKGAATLQTPRRSGGSVQTLQAGLTRGAGSPTLQANPVRGAVQGTLPGESVRGGFAKLKGGHARHRGKPPCVVVPYRHCRLT
jgi:hypothetical protein